MKKTLTFLFLIFCGIGAMAQYTSSPSPGNYTSTVSRDRNGSCGLYFHGDNMLKAIIPSIDGNKIKFRVIKYNNGRPNQFSSGTDVYIKFSNSKNWDDLLCSNDYIRLSRYRSGMYYQRDYYASFSGRKYCLAVSVAGNSEHTRYYSEIITLTKKEERCDAPNHYNFRASDIQETSFEARWQGISGASRYEINVKRTSDYNYNNPVYSRTVYGTSTRITGLKPGTSYKYQVRAKCSNGWSEWSPSSSSFTTKEERCDAPNHYNFRASDIQETSFEARWQGISGASRYEINVKRTSDYNYNNPVYSRTVYGTSTRITGLKPGTSYKYQVRARCSNGWSEWSPSSSSSFTTKSKPKPKPSTPSNPTPRNGATDISTSPTLSWSSYLSGGSVGYDLYFWRSGGTKIKYSGQGTSHKLNSLSEDVTYYWNVISYGNNGTSVTGSTWQFTTKKTPQTINIVQPTSSANYTAGKQMSIKWNYTGTIPYVRILIVSKSAGIEKIIQNKLLNRGEYTYNIPSDFSSASDYMVGVINYNDATVYSRVSNIIISQSCTKPTNLRAKNITSNSFIAEWNKVDGAISYSVYVKKASDSDYTAPIVQGGSSTTSYMVKNLQPNTAYQFIVGTVLQSGDIGKWSSSSNVIKTLSNEVYPTTPQNPTPENNASGIETNPMVSWTSNFANGDIGYDLYIGEVGKERKLYKGRGTKCRIYNLKQNTTYEWRVISYGENGNSAKGPLWKFTTGVANKPSIPSNPNPNNNGQSVSTNPKLTWSSTLSGGTVGYNLYIGKVNQERVVYSGQGTSCNLNNLENNTTYEWRVISYGNNGKNTKGPLWKFTTGEACLSPNPSNIKVRDITSSSFEAYWQPVADAKKYEIIVKKAADANYKQWVASGKITEPQCIITGLTANESYHFVIRAYNGSGWSDWVSYNGTVKTKPSTTTPVSTTITINNMSVRQIGKNVTFNYDITTPNNNSLKYMSIQVDKKGNNYKNAATFGIAKPYSLGRIGVTYEMFNNVLLNKSGMYEFRVIATDTKGNKTPVTIVGTDGDNNKVFFYERAQEGAKVTTPTENEQDISVNIKLSNNKQFVKIEFTSSSKALYYNVYRNGHKFKIIRTKGKIGNQIVTDMLDKSGTYTYKVVPGNYLHQEFSVYDEKSINVTIAEKVKVGHIVGVVTDENENKLTGVKVMVSPTGFETDTKNGVYKTSKMEYGTEGLVTFQKEGYTFPGSIVFTINSENKYINVKATKIPNTKEKDYNNANAGKYDIEVTEPLQVFFGSELVQGGTTQNPIQINNGEYQIKVAVKNVSTGFWKGQLIVELNRNNKIEEVGEYECNLDANATAEYSIPLDFDKIKGIGNLTIKSRKRTDNEEWYSFLNKTSLGERKETASTENGYNKVYADVDVNHFDVDGAMKDIEKRLNNYAKGFKYIKATTDFANEYRQKDSEMLSTISYMSSEIRTTLTTISEPLSYYNEFTSMMDAVDNFRNEKDEFKKYWFVMGKIVSYVGKGHPVTSIIGEYMKVPIAAKDAIDRIVKGVNDTYFENLFGISKINFKLRVKKNGSKRYFNAKEEVAPYISDFYFCYFDKAGNGYQESHMTKYTKDDELDFIYLGLDKEGIMIKKKEPLAIKIRFLNDDILYIPLNDDFVEVKKHYPTDRDYLITIVSEHDSFYENGLHLIRSQILLP